MNDEEKRTIEKIQIIIIFFELFGWTIIGLKLFDKINWSWEYALLPLFLPYFLIYFIFGIFKVIEFILTQKIKKLEKKVNEDKYENITYKVNYKQNKVNYGKEKRKYQKRKPKQ